MRVEGRLSAAGGISQVPRQEEAGSRRYLPLRTVPYYVPYTRYTTLRALAAPVLQSGKAPQPTGPPALGEGRKARQETGET